jgi:hypothetical protein
MNNESSTWTAGEIRKLEQRVAELTVANDEKAGQIRKLREALIMPSLQAARNHLKDYFDKHSVGVKEVISSQWVRGVISGRQEAINILDEVIARAALAATEPKQ